MVALAEYYSALAVCTATEGSRLLQKWQEIYSDKQPLVGKFEFREYGKIIQELLNLLVFGQCKVVSNIPMVWQCLANCIIFGSNYQMDIQCKFKYLIMGNAV